jgi:hypothetical protein
MQSNDGSVGVRDGDIEPAWTTSLAVLVWTAARRSSNNSAELSTAIARGVQWILSHRGVTYSNEEALGHDTSLPAWPWVAGTQRDGVRLLIDRQLPHGGCNYGNTFVLGNRLRPHIQPTGIAVLALDGEADASGRLERSLNFLRQRISPRTATSSLSWGILGLSAHGLRPADSTSWLEFAYRRTMQRDRSPLKLALIAMALQGEQAVIIQLPRTRGESDATNQST